MLSLYAVQQLGVGGEGPIFPCGQPFRFISRLTERIHVTQQNIFIESCTGRYVLDGFGFAQVLFQRNQSAAHFIGTAGQPCGGICLKSTGQVC